jgi:hypothetical protein
LQPPFPNRPASTVPVIPDSATAALNIHDHFMFQSLLLKEIVPSTALADDSHSGIYSR